MNPVATLQLADWRRQTALYADLGSAGQALVIDLNFLYHPSCRYDSRWVCPLAPNDNTIDMPIRAGSGWSCHEFRQALMRQPHRPVRSFALPITKGPVHRVRQ
jgi:Protein of unknown function (DUF1684)